MYFLFFDLNFLIRTFHWAHGEDKNQFFHDDNNTFAIPTSSPVDSRPRELSPYYWPLSLEGSANFPPFPPNFPLDDNFFQKNQSGTGYLTFLLKIIKIRLKLWLGQISPFSALFSLPIKKNSRQILS